MSCIGIDNSRDGSASTLLLLGAELPWTSKRSFILTIIVCGVAYINRDR